MINRDYNDGYPALVWQGVPHGYHEFQGGEGTAESPLEINSALMLDMMRYYPDKEFVLTEDIDLGIEPYNEGLGWEPVGDLFGSFSGVLDGNGYRIMILR